MSANEIKTTDDAWTVELRDVVKRFQSVVAVDHVSLGVRAGEFITLLGPSGCGKTTSLRMIAGFEQPTEGEILINGQPSAFIPPFKRNVNTVFQNYALFPHLSVEDNIAFGLRRRRVPRSERWKRVADAIELVQIGGLAHRWPSELSGGQQQRVALARALVNEPAVLLLDEPLGALDLKLRRSMQSELKALQHRVGTTFVYVTHDQEEALTMSDRIAVMKDGRVLQVGDTAQIYDRPNSRFVASFIGESNFLEGTVRHANDAFVAVDVDGLGVLHAAARAGVATGQRVTLAVRPEKIVMENQPLAKMENGASATITNVVFRGNVTQADARLSNGVTFTLYRVNQTVSRPDSLAPGETIGLRWAPECTAVLTE